MKREFNLGDEVVCTENGKGTVKDSIKHNTYPVCVEFDNDRIDYYTEEGDMYYGEDYEPGDPYIRHLTKLEKALK